MLLALARPSHAADLSGVWWIKDRSQRIALPARAIPFKKSAAALHARNRAAVAAGKIVPIGNGACLPEGMPRLMLARYPIQILQRPEQLTILHERMHMVRFIYLDRPHRVDPEPTYNGESMGRWVGEALEVRSIAFLANTVLDASGIPHSDKMSLTEKFSLRDGGQALRDEITVDDPATFSKPWAFAIDYERRTDVRLMEDVCAFGPPQRDQLSDSARSSP
jgi:hypothetical protein